ncbi:MAG: glycosyltransferase family 4 protein [Verrucomicrobiota bacterium]
MPRNDILITFDSHTPYLAYRVSALQREIKRRNLQDQLHIRVLLLSSHDPNYSWQQNDLEAAYGGTPVTILTEKFHGLGFKSYLTPLALKTVWYTLVDILTNKPKIAFVGGYDRPSSLLIALLGRLLFFKTGPMHDSRFNDAESYSKSLFMELAKAPFMRLYHFFMCSGQECVDYTRFLAGHKRPAQFGGWNILDNDSIAQRADDSSRDSELRAALSLENNEDFFFMPVRFIEKKNIPLVIAAYQNALSTNPHLPRLAIAGKGPLREEVAAHLKESGLDSKVTLVNWLPYELIPRACKLSSAVLLASTHDQWGLTINEALAAGAPVLVSNRCGAHELVQNNLNGFTFSPDNQAHLTQLFSQLGSQPELLASLRSHARQSMSSFSEKQFLAAWFAIFQMCGMVPPIPEA